MTLMRWDPFRELSDIRRTMDRWFEDAFGRAGRLIPVEEFGMPVDLYETDNEVIVKAALPGVKPEDVDISITGETLTIKGESKQESEVKEGNYYRRELRYGSFTRSLPLPTRVVSDRAEATFENGILTITLPKAEEVRPKMVKVTAKPAQQ